MDKAKQLRVPEVEPAQSSAELRLREIDAARRLVKLALYKNLAENTITTAASAAQSGATVYAEQAPIEPPLTYPAYRSSLNAKAIAVVETAPEPTAVNAYDPLANVRAQVNAAYEGEQHV